MGVLFNSSIETLDKISEMIESNTPGGYFRFGDGDVCLATGVTELLQQANPLLSEYMQDAMRLRDDRILRTLPLHTKEWDTLEDGMFPGNHESPLDWCEELYGRFQSVVKEEDITLYTNVALSHIAVQNKERALEFLKQLKPKVKYIIGNKNIPSDVIETLFGKDVKFIKTPDRNSFDRFEDIYNEFVDSVGEDTEYSVVVTSMGCSGRAIQKRIWDNYDNFFLFDFGSLMDALCGDQSRAWIELTKFNGEEFLGLLK